MEEKKPNKSRLTPEEIENFKNLLMAKRVEMLSDVNHMENDTLLKTSSDLSNMPFHMADLGTDNYEQDFTLGLMDGERKVLVEIIDALARIDDGTYGICQGGDEPIPKERLKAMPWARYCVACAGKLEKGRLPAKPQSFTATNFSGSQEEQDEEPDDSV